MRNEVRNEECAMRNKTKRFIFCRNKIMWWFNQSTFQPLYAWLKYNCFSYNALSLRVFDNHNQLFFENYKLLIYFFFQELVNLKLATGNARELGGTGNFFKIDVWIVCVLKPIKSEIAALLQSSRKLTALASAWDTTVTLTPSVRRSAPLSTASVEDSYATTGHHQVEMALSQIASSIGRL